jgi:hypothetical protein
MCTHAAPVSICQPCVNKGTHGAALGCLSFLASLSNILIALSIHLSVTVVLGGGGGRGW